MAGKGPGRPRKADKFGGQIAAAEQKIADRLPELIDLAFKKAEGVLVKEEMPDGTVEYYTTPPDLKAITYLCDRIMGKPTEAIEVSGPDGGALPVSVAFDSAVAKIYGPPSGDSAEAPDTSAPTSDPSTPHRPVP